MLSMNYNLLIKKKNSISGSMHEKDGFKLGFEAGNAFMY